MCFAEEVKIISYYNHNYKMKTFPGEINQYKLIKDTLTALNIAQVTDSNLFGKKYCKLRHIRTDDHLFLPKPRQFQMTAVKRKEYFLSLSF